MTSPDILAEQVRSIGFSCTGCGNCCRRTEEDSGLVMVTCTEIRQIMDATGLPWEEIVIPYPDTVKNRDGNVIHLGWCLRHEGDTCRFLKSGKCSIYRSRPWICRTYPFMLDGDKLDVSVCEGLGCPVSDTTANEIAADLRSRRSAEEAEADRVRDVLARTPVPAACGIVIDSEGVKVIHG